MNFIRVVVLCALCVLSLFLLNQCTDTLNDEDLLIRFESSYKETLSKYRSKQYQNSLNEAIALVELANQIDNAEKIAKSHLLLGSIYRKLGSTALSLKHIYIAKDFFEAANNIKFIGESYKRLGLICIDASHYSLAIEYFNNELEHRINTEDSIKIAHTHYNIARSYNNLAIYDSARIHLSKAIHIYNYYGANNYLNKGYLEMGSINLELGDFEKAEEIYETLIGTLSKSKTSNELLARALNDLGKIKLLTNRRSESLKLFLEAEKLKKEIGDPNLMLTTINNLGDFYAGERDYEKALDYLLEPLIDQDEKVNVDELHVTFTHVIEIYKNQGKPEIALDYSDELIKLLEVKSGKIEWLNEQYDKKEVEVAKLKYENSKLERENAEEKYQNLRLWFIVAIAGFSLIIVGVIMWFIRKDRNEYKELSEELKQQVLPKWQMGNWYRK